MPASVIRSGAILVTVAGLLSACASYPPPQQQFTYYVVPCDTPGAIRTGASPAVAADLPAPATAPPASTNGPATAPGSEAASAPVCIVAASRPPAYASSRYYPSGYYGRSYYARPVFSSFGVGYYGGSHGGGGHRGGGHGGGGQHGGGRH